MTTVVITPREAKEMMVASNGKIFTVCFYKKTDGEYREMNARTGVGIGVKNIGRSFNPDDYDLLGVYDMQKHAHRMVNLKQVVGLRMKDKEYQVRV
jgi:hypothetical protein|tara:strand:- start:2226 stop:2513 length:288 start_codon:yes stop_codon:yes gene_type:complete